MSESAPPSGAESAGVADVPPLQAPLPPPARQVSAQTFARAIVWAGGSQFGQVIIQFPVTIALSRLLLPRDFGLIGMVLVISRFLTVFVEAGLGSALVQRESLEPRHLSTAFWMNIAFGTVLMALVAASAPGIAALYGEPRLTLLTVVVSADFLLGAFGVVQLAMLQRDLQFRRIAVIQNVAAAVGGVSGIGAALLGAGVWSLVVNTLALTLARSVLATRLGAGVPRGRFEQAAARQLWQFSGHQTGFQAINYWARNADNFIIGKVVGPYGLGIYGRAYQLMLLPISQAGFVVSYVLFPMLSRIQGDASRLKTAYLRTISATALLAFPLTVILFLVARDFIVCLFGTRWLDVVPVLRILCVAALPQSIGTTVGVLYQTQGRTDWLFRWGLASSAVVVAGFAVGVLWGVRGVAAAYAIVTLILTYFSFAIPGRLIDLRFREVVQAVMPAFAASVGAATIAWLVRLASPSLPSGASLALLVVVAVLTYALAVHFARLSSYRDLRATIREAFGSG